MGLIQLRAASIFLWISAVGFGWFCIPAISNLRAGRGIPRAFGFPAYGEGPFERHGIPTTVPLLSGFLLVCALEAVAAWLVWGGHRSGAILSLILLPFGCVF